MNSVGHERAELRMPASTRLAMRDKPAPALEIAPRVQTLQATADPIGFFRRCFQAHDGVVRVKMSPTLPPQQVLISDPAALQELMSLDTGREITARDGSMDD